MKEQLATRLEAPLRQRLRVYAAVSGRQVTEVVSAALDGYLPPLAEIVQAAASGSGEAARGRHPRQDAAGPAMSHRVALGPDSCGIAPENRCGPGDEAPRPRTDPHPHVAERERTR